MPRGRGGFGRGWFRRRWLGWGLGWSGNPYPSVDGFRGYRDGGGPIQLTKLTGAPTIDTLGSHTRHTPAKTQRRRCTP